MLSEKHRWSLTLIIVVCLSCFGLAQDQGRSLSQASTPSSDEAALRALVDQYLIAYAQKDLEAFMGLWSEKAVGLDSRRQAMQRMFTGGTSSFSNLVISKVKIEGEKASLRAAVDRRGATTQPNQFYRGRMMLNFEFVKEGSAWKIWRDLPAVVSLVTALVEAKDEEAARALLADDQELVTGELQQLLVGQANRLYERGDYTRALHANHLIQRIAEQLGNRAAVAGALHMIGNVHYLQKNYRLALETYQQSLAIEESLGNKEGMASSLSSIGLTHFVQGNYTAAIAFYQQSLAIYEGLGAKAEMANMLDHIGNTYYEQGEYGLAIESYQQSLALRETPRERANIAGTLHSIGSAQYDQGNYQLALDAYQQALALFEALKDKSAMTRALHNLANCYYLQGDFGAALEYYQKSFAIEEQVGNKQGMASSLYGVGLIHYLQGNDAVAAEHCQKSLALYEAAGDSAGVVAALHSIGDLYFRQGQFASALEYYRKHLAVNESLGDKSKVAWSMLDLGSVQFSQGNHDQALEFYQQGRSQFEALGEQGGIASALLNIALVNYAREQYGVALELADRAAALAKQAGSPDIFWHARHRAGKAHHLLDHPAQAGQAFEEAIATIESKRSQASGEQVLWRLFEDRTSPYLAMVDLLISQDQAAQALAYAERAKAQVLRSVLQSGRVQITKTMTPQEQEQEQKFNQQIAALSTQIYRVQQRAPVNPAYLASLNARLQKARLEYEAFQTRLYAAHPELKALRGEAQPAKPEQAGALLTDTRTALLEYVETEDKTYLFVLTRGGGGRGTRQGPTSRGQKNFLQQPGSRPLPLSLKAYILGLNSKELASRVIRFQELVTRRDEGFQPLARELYDLLLKPSQEQLKGITRLVIIPDGVLWRLPFQALQPAENHYLIEDQALSLVPSLTALRAMTRRRGGGAARPAAPTLFALGNPTLDEKTVGRVKSVLMNEPLDPLPEAEKEVEALGQLYGAGQSQVYVGAEARKELAKAETGKHRVLHFAAHGLLNDASPMHSLLLLSAAQDNQEYGLLEAGEVMRWELQAEVAVFSECETAPGRAGSGKAVMGLTWAWFVAGCPTALLSQWKVGSASTTALMLDFHRQLKSKLQNPALPITKARAWQQAVIRLLQSGQYRHPFYWAGFWLVGDAA